jgi:hypothetical protein
MMKGKECVERIERSKLRSNLPEAHVGDSLLLSERGERSVTQWEQSRIRMGVSWAEHIPKWVSKCSTEC